MRKLLLSDIEKKIEQNRSSIDYAVNKFRARTKKEGWQMARQRPRSPDEIKALDYIGRSMIRKAIQTGEIEYDPERRVFIVAEYLKS